MMKKLMVYILQCSVVLIFCQQVTGQNTTSSYINASSSVQYQLIGTYDVNKINKIVTKELNEFMTGTTVGARNYIDSFAKPKYNVKLYKVIYHSVVPEWDNQPTVASGLIAIPDTGLDSMPMVSYQHGTVFGKNDCPSNPDAWYETKLMIAQFAAQGYIVIAADYFGLGVSDLPNSYLIKSSTEQACVDMLFAAKDILTSKKIKQGPLFLHGWSQGGWNNMVFLRKLESLNIPVTAASTASSPSDAFGTMERWLNNYQPIDAIYLPGCISNYLFAMENYDQLTGLTAAAIRPEYLQVAKEFYDFKIDFPTFMKLTKDKVQDFLKPEFLATGNIANTAFWHNLEKSQAYRWRCKTPLKMYYGELDEVVPIYIAQLPAAYHKLLGINSTAAVEAWAKSDHRATYLYSVIHVKAWYDSFLKKK